MKHLKHEEIAGYGRLGRSFAYIMDKCHCSERTIRKVYALEGITPNRVGPPTALVSAKKPNDVHLGEACHDCGAKHQSGICKILGDLDNRGYAKVCDECWAFRKGCLAAEALGLKRMESIANDYFYRIKPQLDARKANEAEIESDVDQDENGNLITTYSRGGKPCDELGKLLGESHV